MDEIDKQIIKELNKNARVSIKELTDIVFLSAPAVKTRIEKLEEQGIILGYTARINVASLGYLIKAYINWEMDPKLKPTFYPFIQSCKNVLECDCVTGKYSMLIKVAFKNTQELDQFIGQLQRFGSTSTQIVFSTSVENRNVSIEEE